MAINETQFRFEQLSKDPDKRSYLGVGLTLLTLIILSVLIFPAITYITKLNKEISQAKTIDQALGQKVEAIIQAKTNYEEIKKNLPILDAALPSDSEVATYLKTVELLADKHSLNIDKVQFNDIPLLFDKSRKDLEVREINFTVSLEGDFQSVKSYLSALEGFIRTTNVSSLDVTGETLEEKESNTITIRAKVYYLGPAVAKTIQETNLPASSTNKEGVSQ